MGDAAVGLLGEQTFDLVWLTFLTTHIGGHQFWDLSQLDEDKLNESERALLLSTLPDMYAAVDRQLERVLRALPEDADLIVLAPVGMGANTSRADFLGQMLTAVLEGTVPAERAATVPLWRLRAAVPTPARGVITRALGPDARAGGHGAIERRRCRLGQDDGVRRAERPPRTDQAQPPRPGTRRNRRPVGDRRALRADRGGPAQLPRRGRRCVCVRRRPRREHRRPGRARAATAARPARPLGRDAVRAASGRRVPKFGRIERTGSGSGRAGGHTDDAFALLVPGRSRLAKRNGTRAWST